MVALAGLRDRHALEWGLMMLSSGLGKGRTRPETGVHQGSKLFEDPAFLTHAANESVHRNKVVEVQSESFFFVLPRIVYHDQNQGI